MFIQGTMPLTRRLVPLVAIMRAVVPAWPVILFSCSIAPLVLLMLPRSSTCERAGPLLPTVMMMLLPPSAMNTLPSFCDELVASRPVALKIPPRIDMPAALLMRSMMGIVPVSEMLSVPPLMAMLAVPESLPSSSSDKLPPVMSVAPV